MKVVAGLSGGVDSSAVAYLLTKSCNEVSGVTMKLHSDFNDLCGGQKDIDDAKAICEKLNIPFNVLDFCSDFEEHVIKDFVMSYQKGETPNPCINCNKYLKFDKLLQYALSNDFEYVATGHYAKIENYNGRFLLKKATDLNKDQSYYLYKLSQEQLSHTLFPLGDYTKDKAREIAKEAGFVNYSKHDSQDICFIPGGDYSSFIKSYTHKDFPYGKFIDINGNVLGEHKGIINYTIGQRKGLGVSSTSPLFVTKIDTENNTITLSHGEGLFSNTLYAKDVNLISIDKISEPIRVKAKIRYRQKEQNATVYDAGDNMIKVVFDEDQRAITKGQAVVLYDNDIVVGGGTII